MPNGKTTIYGVVECGQCVGVLPFVNDQHVVLVRQYRYVFGENNRWEMPTGGVKSGETILEAAHRELREESGYDAAQLDPVCIYYPSKSIVQEVAHLFIGRSLVQVNELPDHTEFFEIQTFPFEQVVQMVEDSEIRDSMSVIAILHAARAPGL